MARPLTTIRSVSDLVQHGDGTLAGGERRWNPSELAEVCVSLASQLQSKGAVPGTRVCYLPPPGELGAIAFLSIASSASAAPMNPKATDPEIIAYINALAPSLVVVDKERAERIRKMVDVPVASWDVSSGGLRLSEYSTVSNAVFADNDDIALILPTSGTTGLPKQVPLTNAQILSSASNIAAWLSLTTDDVSLTMMPLFHVHGLVAGLLAPLLGGGTAAVEPFDALRFGSAMHRHRPTWFSAVPTMHALLADRWESRLDSLPISQLRFLRTSSSALPPPLLERLEGIFGVPVAEAYGMTEASHQIAANPITPGDRRPGSVGVATGSEVRIENPDQDGRGQVLVKGPQVTTGYRNNDAANSTAFIDGWFRTGDEGYLDGDWLTLTGRLKEMINRGGEKISPLEVEQALLNVPGVRACVAFAVPHEKLGEEVGAAIVSDDVSLELSRVRHNLKQVL